MVQELLTKLQVKLQESEMKAKLQEASATYCSSTAGETMSIAEVRREGRKIFSKMQCLVSICCS